MQRLIFSLILIACSLASAQLPVIPLYQNPSSGTNADVIGVPGLAEWWMFSDLVTNNMPITNWYGRIQYVIATNGAASLQPTNSANGVMYGQNNGRQFLTNMPINIGSNWTVVVRAKATREGYSFSSLYPLWGEFGNNWVGGWGDGTSPKATLSWNTHGNSAQSTAQLNGIIGTYIDHMMVNSNNANGAGKLYLYTNAVLISSATAEPNVTKFSSMSWNGGLFNVADCYDGLVEDYLVYTNVLTPAQLLTVYQWHTNHLQ